MWRCLPTLAGAETWSGLMNVSCVSLMWCRRTVCESLLQPSDWRKKVCSWQDRWSCFALPPVSTVLLVSVSGSDPQTPLWRSGFLWALVVAVLDQLQGLSFQYPHCAGGGNRGSRKLESRQPALPKWCEERQLLAFVYLCICWIKVKNLVVLFCPG